MDHSLALTALLYLPVGVMLVLALLQAGCKAGVPLARSLAERYAAVSPLTKATVLLMLASACIHLGLVPDHMCRHWNVHLPLQCGGAQATFLRGGIREPFTALLFALDGVGLIAVSIPAFLTPAWRLLATPLLATTVLAYVYYLATSKEEPDPIGLACKLIELTALTLIVIRWWLPRVFITTAASGAASL